MACQSVEKTYLEMTDFDIFKNTKCLAGVSNLFGVFQAIKRQFGNGFPGLHSPGESYLYRCDDCTQKRLVDCTKTRDICDIHFKNKTLLLVKTNKCGWTLWCLL